ncbi:MAG: hypothetical protein DWQ36_14175 [Acidobacteria bacterium]|nr:MAG: hypothetical protein DWQ36_14175 [Acidobacteriota bacterium]
MSEGVFDERKQALEDLFFKNQDKALKERYRAAKEIAAQKDALAQASGIQDDAVLTHLIEVGLDGQTVAALTLVPLIEVAWADQAIERRERQAILEAAQEAGIKQGSPSADLLDGWLEHRPGHELLDAWKEYVRELTSQLGADGAAALRAEVLGKARQVAEAAGGMLGIGRVNQQEEERLAELARTFE